MKICDLEYDVRVSKKLSELTAEDLTNICEDTHAYCNEVCPIYDCVFTDKEKIKDGCPYFKDGKKMRRKLQSMLKDGD